LSRPERASSSRRHRVNAIDARIRPFIFESQQRCRATSARARSLDERVIYFFLFFLDPTTNAPRRTRRVDARETRARRDDASMDDESSRSSDDRPRDR